MKFSLHSLIFATWLFGCNSSSSFNGGTPSPSSPSFTYVFAGTQTLGVFRSSDYGLSWQHGDGIPLGTSSAIMSLCSCGSNLYAGTYDAGLYRSTDDGVNWTRVLNY